MEQLQPPPDGDRNREGRLLAAIWVPVPIMIAVLVPRFIVRLRMRNFGYDDWLMYTCFVLFIILDIFETLYVIHGGARHAYYLSASTLSEIFEWHFIAQPFGTIASAAGKTSIACLTFRIISPSIFWRKWFLLITLGIYWILTIISTVLILAQCNPTRALWEHVPGAKCLDPSITNNILISQSAYGAFIDFVLAIIPGTIIWKLNLSTKTKISLNILLSLGLVAGIVAVIKVAQFVQLEHDLDATWASYDIIIWAEVEISLVVFCGSVPTLKPIFDRLYKRKPIAPVSSRSHIRSQNDHFKLLEMGKSGGEGHPTPSSLSPTKFKSRTNTLVEEDDDDES